MAEETVYKVSKDWKKQAFIDKDAYEKLYSKSVEKPDKFWGKEGERIDWIKPYTAVKNTSFAYPDVSIKWFEDGTLNVSANCIDRHLKKRKHQVAIIWEPDDPAEAPRHITYGELHREVNVFANVLKAMGVKRGDRVTIYLPMIPEAAYAMLACARIGAIHSVVFGGFSPDSLAGRITDCKSKVIVTADEGVRGGVAHRRDPELLAQLARRAAVVSHRHDRGDVAADLLEAAQERREAGAAADGDDVRPARERALLVDELHERLTAGRERLEEDSEEAPQAHRDDDDAQHDDDERAQQAGQEVQARDLEDLAGERTRGDVLEGDPDGERTRRGEDRHAHEHDEQPALDAGARSQPAAQLAETALGGSVAHRRFSSRCQTLTGPRSSSRRRSASASLMATDRWYPPVQPIPTVSRVLPSARYAGIVENPPPYIERITQKHATNRARLPTAADHGTVEYSAIPNRKNTAYVALRPIRSDSDAQKIRPAMLNSESNPVNPAAIAAICASCD